jgi:hypothetical protein
VGVPPKVQLFLWLLSHNKLAIVDNLKKRGLDRPEQCCFCHEKESIVHLFFECVVSKAIWSYVCEFLGFSTGPDYISVASKWLHEKKFYSVNISSTVTLRGIWLTINDFICHKQAWLDVKTILRRDAEVNHGMEYIFQGTEQGGDEMVIFFGEVDPRAVDDRKPMKTVLGNQIRYAPNVRREVTMDVN